MEAKKSKRADLESKRPLFLQIGFIIALGTVLLAFEWDSCETSSEVFGPLDRTNTDIEELMPVTRPEEKQKELPKPVTIELIEIVDDITPLAGEIPEMTSEATKETAIDPANLVKPEIEKEETVFLMGTLDQNPEFPGGMLGLQKFLAKSVNYPMIAQETGIQGTVYLTFIINKSGKVEQVKLMRGVDPSLDKEALRVVNTMPDWKPGKQGGIPVKVSYQVPIKFTLKM